MYRLCFVLFIVSLAHSASVPIDRDTLQSVFGPPPGYLYRADAQALAASGVQPATQSPIASTTNGTLVDPDYWDFTESVADYDQFDWTLTRRVAASSKQNFLLSPLGLKLALAILAEAATGPTQTEMASVLGFDLDRHVVRRKFANILESLQEVSSQYILNLGSRVYIEENADPRQRFAAIAEQFYKTEIARVDFHNPESAAKEINSWVSNKTNGRITDLVEEEDVKAAVVLILNTLYFKGNWRHQFPPNATRVESFYVSPTVTKQTLFMNVKEKFRYAESAAYDAKILRMPYLGRKFSMYIVVPNSLTGLDRVFNGLSGLRTELHYMQDTFIDLILPKFQFDYTSVLDGVLKELGIRTAFEDTASFPGIARGQQLSQRLKISKVLQRSGIEVNELGSVAYTATEVSLVNKFGEDYTEVIANRPFLFFIEDEATRQLLFTGRVSDPSSTDGAFKLP